MRRLAFLAVLLVITVPAASAHPFTEQTIPSLASNPPAGVTQVITYYSEPVDVEFSKLEVFDGAGNRVDLGDTAYHEGETSLIVTTQPLPDGVYTVSSRVLSKVDGHIVPDAFLFAVGSAIVDPALLGEKEIELIFLPEAGARFPGIVGQTIVLGAAIAAIAVWTVHKRDYITDIRGIEQRRHSKLMALTGVGLVLVLASDILMIAVQAIRLGAPVFDTVQTYFGMIWLARLAITIAMIGIWFVLDKRGTTKKSMYAMLVSSLVLISTTTLIGHAAASGEPAAIMLDYMHNLVAGAWIGGILYMLFVMVPSISSLEHTQKERMSLAYLPRFSTIFTISLGAVIVTGPALLWFVETDVGMIVQSVYGQLILLKVGIAAAMVSLGFVIQYVVQKRAGDPESGNTRVHRTMRRTLRADAILGIALLGVVAMLVNGTVPEGQLQELDLPPEGYSATEFTENAAFAVDIYPFTSGTNLIDVAVSAPGGGPLYDSDSIKVKVSNPARGIPPIEVHMERGGDGKFAGEATFGFSGMWQVEIEAQRTENPNESKILDLMVKPRLSDAQISIAEHPLPEPAKPLHPVYHNGYIWISDPSAPRIWQFDPETKVFDMHVFDGLATTFLAPEGDTMWFLDTPASTLGRLDIATGGIDTITIPRLDPVQDANTPIGLLADGDAVWITIINKDRIARYDITTGEFGEIRLPRGSLPFAIVQGPDGYVWYSATGPGALGRIDPGTMQAEMIDVGFELQAPEAILFDAGGMLWISEHTGSAIVRYDHAFGTAQRITVPDSDALPFGMAFDRYGNLWFAQHTIDKIGAYDPDRGEITEAPIDGENTFVQFIASDDDGNIWTIGQNSNSLGLVSITEVPATAPERPAIQSMRYAEVAGPLMAAGIIAASLSLVGTVRNRP